MHQLKYEDFLQEDVPEGWKSACISIHSHWLSAEEASNHWMSFVTIKGKNDPNRENYLRSENNFIRFFKILDADFGLSVLKQNINNSASSSVSVLSEESVTKNVREERFDAFTSEKLNCVILGNFDLTFPIFIPSGKGWGEIEEVAHKCSLYVLK